MAEPDFTIRPLDDSDFDELVGIMAEGFPRHGTDFWRDRLRVVGERERAPGTQKYGYGIEAGGLQGAALALGSLHGPPDARQTIVNISSWTVRPSHRGPPAKELYRHASSFDGFTYSNLSAAAHTLKTITRFGFREGTAGQVIGLGLRRGPGAARRMVSTGEAGRAGLPDYKVELLRHHERHGCVAFCLELEDRLAPLIFLPRRLKPGIPVAQLIYCERLGEFQANSRSIFLRLLGKGFAALLVDGSGPIDGLRGRYYPGKAAKYYKGPMPVHDVDHSYSEMIYIGF
jgi:hypothetical protein